MDWKRTVSKAGIVLTVFCLAVAAPAMAAAPAPAVKYAPALAGKRVLFLGDSITQSGAYIDCIEYYLMQRLSPDKVDIIGAGLASETTSGLTEKVHPGPRPCIFKRLAPLLAQAKPQIVVACYGMNDGIYQPFDEVRFQAYKDGIIRLVTNCVAAGAEVILLTPPPFDPRPFGEKVSQDDTGPGYTKPYVKYDEVLAAYSKWIMSLHMEKLTTIDLHTAMIEYRAKRQVAKPQYALTRDGIHPEEVGHQVMARAFLQSVGLKVDDTDLDAEWRRLCHDPVFKLVTQRRGQRSKAWLYFSLGHQKKEELAAAEESAKALLAQIKEAGKGNEATPPAK